MEKKSIGKITPSEFYKMRRPEYFSDSETIYESQLLRENLAFELNQITTNQKQDEFETLCRRLAEKFITPNLIPQVGPTGGGDGKTDSETYPVSEFISDRWFIPENGWNKDEKWAFAISAKATWKSKAKGDVKKIVETEREYTKVYFMTNQTPSSKKKKDAQDEFEKEFKVEVVILDGEWILEKIYINDLVDLAVDSLNLSSTFKKKITSVGQNDAYRIKKLNELEEKIGNSYRYFEYDFQLVEDALESAILSRMLGKSRDEVEGKFDRAIRFCKKNNNKKQWLRIHYQRAWTYMNWYDDYASFINEYKLFKEYLSEDPSSSEIELYNSLLNLLRVLNITDHCDLLNFNIKIEEEKTEFVNLLNQLEKNKQKPSTALIAGIYKSLHGLMDSISERIDPTDHLFDISRYLLRSKSHIDFPFESFKTIIEELGEHFPNHEEYDNLIDCIASLSEKRNSELYAGETFLKRGRQKLSAGYNKESIIYFGKAVMKLAKEESQNGMYLTLIGLSQAYSAIGLIWASNNCLISASSIASKSWYEKGIFDERIYYCIKQLAINELFIGRIPSFFIWHELFHVISRQIETHDYENDISSDELMDACLAVRILNTDYKKDNLLSNLPDLFENQKLWLTKNACLYKLGYTDLILGDFKGINIFDEVGLDIHFELVANQPFINQMMFETNFLSESKIKITSIILGCKFNIVFKNDQELLLASETFLAFVESFLATSLTDIYPNTETVNIQLIRNPEVEVFNFHNKESSSEYTVEINEFSFSQKSQDRIWKSMLEFVGSLLAENFFLHDPQEYLEKLFAKEEVYERLSLIFGHRNFTFNILSDKSKYFLSDWVDNKTLKEYPFKRKTPISFDFKKQEVETENSEVKFDLDNVAHNKRTVFSIIDTSIWDKAKWKGFGFFRDSSGLGIFLAYEDENAGKKIFDNWIKKVGKEDKEEQIKITIIKGVDRNNPFWYRVHISSNIENKEFKPGNLLISASRFHEMNAVSSKNLDNLINGFKILKKYRLCPAKIIDLRTGAIEPYFDKAILKKELHIKNAWEIGEHDLDNVVIKKDDSPIIPENEQSPPVLNVLKSKRH